MGLSKQARAIVDASSGGFLPDFIAKTVARLAAKRKVPSPGPGEKLVLGKDGTWTLEKQEPERFRKSGGGLSPKTIEFLKSMTGTSPAEQLLKEIRTSPLNNAERAAVIAGLEPAMAKSMRAHRRVLKVGGMVKRAGMTPLSGLTLPQVPAKPTAGLSTEPEFEQEITAEALTPAAAAQLFMDRRREMRREGMPGMRPTLRTDAYGAKD